MFSGKLEMEMGYYLRKANSLDKKIVYEWANDPETRKNSFQTELIKWEEHEAWYQDVLASMAENAPEGTVLYICMDFMLPVGSIRLKKDGQGSALISYTVAPQFRGQGIGSRMLHLLEEEMQKYGKDVTCLTGEVKEGNTASARIFEKLGYVREAGGGKGQGAPLSFRKELSASQNTEARLTAVPGGRQANFELLRVLAMLMVIALHYMGKGGLLAANVAQDGSLKNWCMWGAEALCVAAVNVYVLISGYFLADKKFRLGKLAALWCQVFFYSVVTAAVLMLAGIVNYKEYMDLFQIQFFVFPAINGHYWFASAYLVFYILAPALGAGLKRLTKRQHRILLLLLLGVFCLSKTLIPFELPLDDKGNSFVWFLCLFAAAAYYRNHGMPWLQKKGRGLLVFVLSTAAGLLALALAAELFRQTGKYGQILDIPLSYNSVFVFLASLGLFSAFACWQVKENALVRFLARLAPYTFGVYLLHEHLLLRYRWPQWLHVGGTYGWLRPVHLLLTVLLVFSVGVLVDVLRKLLFDLCGKLIVWALKIYYAKREVWDYLIFGALTTAVNWVAYVFCAYFMLVPLLGKATTANAMVSNTIAWIAAVVFAYITNRNFVFHSEVTGGPALLKEFLSFVGARVFSFLVEQAMLFVMVNLMRMNDLVSKLIIGIVVIVLNYIFSKLWIFKKPKA